MKSQTANWSKDMLVASYHHLRVEYLKQAEACIALLIERYCNLLIDESSTLQEKERWQQQASYWNQCYQLNKNSRS